MINYQGYRPNESFFAAANGYCGFKSIFNKIFKPTDFKKLFILKGGPGTGKSSIMKGLVKQANEKGIYTKGIFCSSDPNSLDGVILTSENRSIAVIDGTAPHMTDPQYPGAIDEIVNLGESFNVDKLAESRAKIVSLGDKKSKAYKDAYSYLSLAGELYEFLMDKKLKTVNYNEAERIVEKIISRYGSDTEYVNPTEFYISSFGKFGYRRLSKVNIGSRTLISIDGDGYSEYIIMGMLKERLIREKKVMVLCPSPLDIKYTDAIATDKYVFITNCDSDTRIDTTAALIEKGQKQKGEELYDALLELAIESFALASDFHFEIEKIYSASMDFTNNDKIYDNLLRRINYELGCC